MAATDGQIAVAAARWADEGNYLKEFVVKQSLPAIVKIIKGQYGGLGVPTLPSPSLQSTALLVSLGKKHKIVAQAVKIKEGRRLVCIGPRLLIPEGYPGYFELLSEDGRAVRCIESVAELARRRPEEGCLVRENIRAMHAKTDHDGTIFPEGGCTVPPGELLIPAGEILLPKGRFLKCRNSNGAVLLLGLEQRGKFSALAREDNISGVHTAKNLLSKRLPLTVRLVHGTTPRGLKTPNHFVPELRLLSILEEDHLFALPLQQKEANSVIALPLAAPLKLLRTRNSDQLCTMPEVSRLIDKSNKLAQEVADRVQVLDGKLGDPKKELPVLKKVRGKDENRPLTTHEYDQIDEIYDYVRGVAPLPKKEIKPEPPPIETIPTKKLQAEKRNRRGTVATNQARVFLHPEKGPPNLPKLYIKSAKANGRLFKSASPLKDTPSPVSPMSKSGSPIFNIRYKSLNNLQQAMELDGTLDSSHSGGRASGDSGGFLKHPEKRSRKLSRPRSLTNLVWERPEVALIQMPVVDKLKSKLIIEPTAIVYKKHAKYSVNGQNRQKRGTLYL